MLQGHLVFSQNYLKYLQQKYRMFEKEIIGNALELRTEKGSWKTAGNGSQSRLIDQLETTIYNLDLEILYLLIKFKFVSACPTCNRRCLFNCYRSIVQTVTEITKKMIIMKNIKRKASVTEAGKSRFYFT
uniref:Uncharacterized protein n=1 Tax=Cacopsylla melanoneura TaxID=428564 RepID=A0A8D8W1Z5_9HEMI